MYTLLFTVSAQADMDFWKKSGQKPIQKKLKKLFYELEEHPHIGTGKPERLSKDFAGTWSRRVTGEHRLLYKIDDKNHIVVILSMKGHYYEK
ncbi:MAG: Txe/YoeB family addiction module toxin [Prevotellaceae bacterium]|jgi:toxin YoeB|nr:Txe/YoeB family addiction module toxin [Prevotellaceae bacterium]